ncbi:MAG: STAS domain-containing protein [Desulfatitalea sp.]|nr:ABC transporter permease [Desulfatitalea sp.]NNK02268.1 STAS domain-containing protein [Desulfatitalea sp.]
MNMRSPTVETARAKTEFYNVVTSKDGAVGIQFIGRIDHQVAAVILKMLLDDVKHRRPRQVTVDLNRVTYFDDFGVLILAELRNWLDENQIPFRLVQPPVKAAEILTLTNFDNMDLCAPLPRPKGNPMIVRLGDAAIRTADNVRHLVSFLGSVVLCMLHAARHPKSLRWGDILVLMQKTGVDAVPIVGLISFLLGLIMAFVSSLQLAQFGASIYVARLVALSMVSELGPIMTAIVVSGRSGSAFAAEIGSMRISDEIDALFTMGFSPTLFLAVPRIIAAVLVVPLLTLFSDLFAIIGGLVISVTMLDLTVSTYVDQTIKALDLFEFMWGLSKSVVFAALISWIACLRGFEVRGGSAEVGNAATSAVVSGIFLIILFDSMFAVIRSYW